MFCAAIPAALAVGANAQARQNREDNQARRRHVPPRRTKIQPKTTTVLVVAGLAAASVVYHTQLGG
jgi:uncharacterized membrane protein YidH (DUF202 family)